jgi:hypothetical protein
MTITIPQTSSIHNQTRVIERPDGLHWQDKSTGEMCGSFPTLLEAVQDMQSQENTGYEDGESLAEADIGIVGWVDPETGELAEDLQLHLSDE